MKELKIIMLKKNLRFFLLLLITINSYSQTYVTWNPATNAAGVMGNFPGGTVWTTLGATGRPIQFRSPSANQLNLVVNGSSTFSTYGTSNFNPPSASMTFNFSTPVIVTRYNMVDIDMGGSWNDSFNFANILFTNAAATNCIATVNGAVPTIDVSSNGEFASWRCSNPVTNFTLNYLNTNGRTHAFLGYSLEVLVLPIIPAVCSNTTAPNLPATIGNGVTGTWNPAIINTSVPGIFPYTFTPGPGQIIACPVRINVTILSCCPVTRTLSTPLNDVIGTANQEVQQTIFASNIINSGAHAVYHGDFFVELNPGFEANTGSEFAAYIAGCDGSATYKDSNEIVEIPEIEVITYRDQKNADGLQVYPNPSSNSVKIEVPNDRIGSIQIVSMDGRVIFDRQLNSEYFEVDVSNFANGIYIINATSENGSLFTEKLIKN